MRTSELRRIEIIGFNGCCDQVLSTTSSIAHIPIVLYAFIFSLRILQAENCDAKSGSITFQIQIHRYYCNRPALRMYRLHRLALDGARSADACTFEL